MPDPERPDRGLPTVRQELAAVVGVGHELSFFRRFLVSGAANTLLTYMLYILLLDAIGHRLAYSAAFLTGIGLAYFLNRNFVFESHAGWRSVLAIPLIYLFQYGLGLAVVEGWVTWLQWPSQLAPLAAIGATLPLTYLLTRAAFLLR